MTTSELQVTVRERDGARCSICTARSTARPSERSPGLRRGGGAAERGSSLNFEHVELHQQHRHRPDRRPAGAGARAAGRGSACGLSEHYREIFEITRLADFMRISDSEDGAVSGAERGAVHD